MKIPRKISPDNLKDTIIQVVYTAEPAPELLLGYVEQTLKGIFHFITGIPKDENSKNDKGFLIVNEVEKGFFISNDGKFKLNVTPSTLIFNQQEKYSGWHDYSACISETLTRLFGNRIIIDVSRVGVRYISQFPSTDVFESTQVNINMTGLSFGDGLATQFRTEIVEENFKSIITLVNRIEKKNSLNTIGIIDIDVIQVFESDLSDFQVLLRSIEKGHEKQKAIFFSLITDVFLNSLNPEY